MRRRNLCACLLVAFTAFGAGSAGAAQPLRPASAAGQSLLTAINSARAAAGVGPLRTSAQLTLAATWQSQVLARAGILDHTSPDGSTLNDRLARARWRGGQAGEDLAVATSPALALSLWMQSPGHRENLLRPTFRTIGLGLVRGVWNGRTALYVTADFAS